jgi:hypothetical protein
MELLQLVLVRSLFLKTIMIREKLDLLSILVEPLCASQQAVQRQRA